MQQRAEAENKEGKYINARALYIKAFEDYFGKGKLQQGVECGVKAAPLYYGDNMYQEAMTAELFIPDGCRAATPAGECGPGRCEFRWRLRTELSRRPGESSATAV